MGIEIELNGVNLAQFVEHDLLTPGTTPVVATERAIVAHLFEQFRDGVGDKLVNSPSIRLHDMYFKERYASLPALIESGYETWYTEISFDTRAGTRINDLQIFASGIDLIPIDYGFGNTRKVQLKSSHLKTKPTHNFRINHLRVPGKVFQDVLDRLNTKEAIHQPLIANFAPAGWSDFDRGFQLVGYRLVSYDHMVTGERYFCACAKSFHAHILTDAREKASHYVPGSWPHAFVELLKEPKYTKNICHLCIAREEGVEESAYRYGATIHEGFEAFVDQVKFNLSIDDKTARAEVMQVLGLSRWVRESTIYGLIRGIFPNHTVLREASPKWLGRMRIDIYLPELGLALEHQGEQHYHPIKMFGGEQGHKRILERDALKRKLCGENNITLIDISYFDDISETALLKRLSEFITPLHVRRSGRA